MNPNQKPKTAGRRIIIIVTIRAGFNPWFIRIFLAVSFIIAPTVTNNNTSTKEGNLQSTNPRPLWQSGQRIC